jgi:hypothetical protein
MAMQGNVSIKHDALLWGCLDSYAAGKPVRERDAGFPAVALIRVKEILAWFQFVEASLPARPATFVDRALVGWL